MYKQILQVYKYLYKYSQLVKYIFKLQPMKFLPPGLQQISTHTYGTLYLQLSDIKTNITSQNLTYTPYFFGQSTNQNINNTNQLNKMPLCQYQFGECVQYKIITNLWHFYMYLSDMQYIDIHINTNNNNNNNNRYPTNQFKLSHQNQQNQSLLYTRIRLQLKSIKQVMNTQFKNQNIFKNNKQQLQKCTIVDSKGNVKGSLSVKIWSIFNMQICQQIKQLIDFSTMIIFEGISPINSENQLPRQPPQQLSVDLNVNINKRTNTEITKNLDYNEIQIQNIQRNTHKQQIFSQPQQSSIRMQQFEHLHNVDNSDKQDQRILQDDIDRLIRQMQSKPYDSSRYQQNSNNNNQNNNYGKCTQSQYPQLHKSNTQSQFHSSNTYNLQTQSKLPNYSKNQSYNNSLNSHKFLQTQTSLKHLSRPPSYSPKPKQKINTQTPQQTIRSKSPYLIKNPQIPIPKPTQLPYQKSDNSYIQLKIHEMLVSISNALPHTLFEQLMQPCYTIKIYLNNDQQQYFAGQGIKQGEVVTFNQSLKIRNVGIVKSIKFAICDDYGRVQCQGIFDLGRLYASKDLKGVFTVPLIAYTNNALHQKLTVNANKLLQVSPLHRTLRLQAQLVQKIQLVQIFIKISKVNIPFTLLRYKIPLTKQTIQHVGSNHVNIFPHTCNAQTPDKLIIQFWKNQQNIGQIQISLKNIKNINATALNNNVDPVYLYEGKKQIRNILQNDRVMGDCNITVCFGNVKQMQSLLLGTIDQQKLVIKQKQNKIPVTLDQRLGVFVNKKPVQSNQISIQVQIDQQKTAYLQNSNQKFENDKYNKINMNNNQPSFGDQSMISHTSHNQFMDGSLVSFAKHDQHHQQQQFIPIIPNLKSQKSQPSQNFPTLLSQISKNLCQLLTPILPYLPKLKQLSKPHLTYNFISIDKLKQILTSLGLKIKLINNIFNLILLPKNDMVNINILYDLLMSVQIQDNIKDNLIVDEIIVVWGLRLLYGRQQKQKKRKNQDQILLQSDMQFREMVDMYRRIKIKLNLHEYKILEKFMKKYPNRKSALQLKKAVITQLQMQSVEQIKQGFYQQDILKQIYGDDSSNRMNNSSYNLHHNYQEDSDYYNQFGNVKKQKNFGVQIKKQVKQDIKQQRKDKIKQQNKKQLLDNFSFKQTRIQSNTQTQSKPSLSSKNTLKTQSPIKPSIKQTNKIQLSGIQNVIQSAQCIFQTLSKPITFNILIDYPIKKQLLFDTNNKIKQFQVQLQNGNQIKDIDGRVDLLSNGKIIASAAFSLIKQVKSLYALKSVNGEFCGLLHIMLS